MKIKLMALVAWLAMGCALNTNGLSTDDEDRVLPDIMSDETEPDVFDATDENVTREDVAADETTDEAREPDETTAEDVTDVPEDAEPEDAAEDEAADEGGEEDGEADDGGTVDPCTPPEIPADGLYLFFCFSEDITSEMVMWRWVERDWAPNVLWETEPGCRIASSRTLFCRVEIYRDAIYDFNIEMPGLVIPAFCGGALDPCWSCGPGLSSPLGTPRVWLYGVPVEVTFDSNGGTGCNHTFTVPEL